MSDYDLTDPLRSSREAVEDVRVSVDPAGAPRPPELDQGSIFSGAGMSEREDPGPSPYLSDGAGAEPPTEENRKYLAEAKKRLAEREEFERQLAKKEFFPILQRPGNLMRMGVDQANKLLAMEPRTRELADQLQKLDSARAKAEWREWLRPKLEKYDALISERQELLRQMREGAPGFSARPEFDPMLGEFGAPPQEADRVVDLTGEAANLAEYMRPALERAGYETDWLSKVGPGFMQNLDELSLTYQRMPGAAYLEGVDRALSDAVSYEMGGLDEGAPTIRLRAPDPGVASVRPELGPQLGANEDLDAAPLVPLYRRWVRSTGRKDALAGSPEITLSGPDAAEFLAFVQKDVDRDRASIKEIDDALQKIDLLRVGAELSPFMGSSGVPGFSAKEAYQGTVSAAENAPTLLLGFGAAGVGLKALGAAIATAPGGVRGYSQGYRAAVKAGVSETEAHILGALYSAAEVIPERVGFGLGVARADKLFLATAGNRRRAMVEALHYMATGVMTSAATEPLQEAATSIAQSLADIAILDDGSTLEEIAKRAYQDGKIGLWAGVLLGGGGATVGGSLKTLRRFTDKGVKEAEDEAMRLAARERSQRSEEDKARKILDEISAPAEGGEASAELDRSTEIASRQTFPFQTAVLGRSREEIERALDDWGLFEAEGRRRGLDDEAAKAYADLSLALTVDPESSFAGERAQNIRVALIGQVAGQGFAWDGTPQEALNAVVEADPSGFQQNAQRIIDTAGKASQSAPAIRLGFINHLADQGKELYKSADADQFEATEGAQDLLLAQKGYGEMILNAEDLVKSLTPESDEEATAADREYADKYNVPLREAIGKRRAREHLEGSLGLEETAVRQAIEQNGDVTFRTSRWQARVANQKSAELQGLDQFIRRHGKFARGDASVADVSRARMREEVEASDVAERLTPDVLRDIEKEGSEAHRIYTSIVGTLILNGDNRFTAERKALIEMAMLHTGVANINRDGQERLDALKGLEAPGRDVKAERQAAEVAASYTLSQAFADWMAGFAENTRSPFGFRGAMQASKWAPPGEDDLPQDGEEAVDREPRLPSGDADFVSTRGQPGRPLSPEPTAPRDVGSEPLPAKSFNFQPFTMDSGEVLDLDALRANPRKLVNALRGLSAAELRRLREENGLKESVVPSGAVVVETDVSKAKWVNAFLKFLAGEARANAAIDGAPEREMGRAADESIRDVLSKQPFATPEAVDALPDAEDGAALSDVARESLDAGDFSVTDRPKTLRASEIKRPNLTLREDARGDLFSRVLGKARFYDLSASDQQEVVKSFWDESTGEADQKNLMPEGATIETALGKLILEARSGAERDAVAWKIREGVESDSPIPEGFPFEERVEARLQKAIDRAVSKQSPLGDAVARPGPFVVDAYGSLIFASDNLSADWAYISALDPDAEIPAYILRPSKPLDTMEGEVRRWLERQIKEAYPNPGEAPIRIAAWEGYASSRGGDQVDAPVLGQVAPGGVVAGAAPLTDRRDGPALSAPDPNLSRKINQPIWDKIGRAAYGYLSAIAKRGGSVGSRPGLGAVLIDRRGANKAKAPGRQTNAYLLVKSLPELISSGREVQFEQADGSRSPRNPVNTDLVKGSQSPAQRSENQRRADNKVAKGVRAYRAIEAAGHDANGLLHVVRIDLEERSTDSAEETALYFHGMTAYLPESAEAQAVLEGMGADVPSAERSAALDAFFGDTPSERRTLLHTARRAGDREALDAFPGELGPHLTSRGLAEIYAGQIREGRRGLDNEAIEAQVYEAYARLENPLRVPALEEFSNTADVARAAYLAGAIDKSVLAQVEDVYDFGEDSAANKTYLGSARFVRAADILRTALLDGGYDALVYTLRGAEVYVPLLPAKSPEAERFDIGAPQLLAQRRPPLSKDALIERVVERIEANLAAQNRAMEFKFGEPVQTPESVEAEAILGQLRAVADEDLSSTLESARAQIASAEEIMAQVRETGVWRDGDEAPTPFDTEPAGLNGAVIREIDAFLNATAPISSRDWRLRATTRLINIAESMVEDDDGKVVVADFLRAVKRQAKREQLAEVEDIIPRVDDFVEALRDARRRQGRSAGAFAGASRRVQKEDAVAAMRLLAPAYKIATRYDDEARGVERGLTAPGWERAIEFYIADPALSGPIIRELPSFYMDSHHLDSVSAMARLSLRRDQRGVLGLHIDNAQSELDQHLAVRGPRTAEEQKILDGYNKDIASGYYLDSNGRRARFTDAEWSTVDDLLRQKNPSKDAIDPVRALYEYEKTRRDYLATPVPGALLRGGAWKSALIEAALQAAVDQGLNHVTLMTPERGAALVGSSDTAAYARFYGEAGQFRQILNKLLAPHGVVEGSALPAGLDKTIFRWADGYSDLVSESRGHGLALLQVTLQQIEAAAADGKIGDPSLAAEAAELLDQLRQIHEFDAARPYAQDNEWILRVIDGAFGEAAGAAIKEALVSGIDLADGSRIEPVLVQERTPSPMWELTPAARERFRSPVEIAQTDREKRLAGWTRPRLDGSGRTIGAEVGLTEWSNHTTMIEEGAHSAFLMLRWHASQPWASEQTKQRYALWLKWLGLPMEQEHYLDDYGTPDAPGRGEVYHERVAKAVVRYQYTGISPVPWLTEALGYVGTLVREHVKAFAIFNFMFGAPVKGEGGRTARETDFVQNDVDARQLIDRFLATDELLAKAAEEMPMRGLFANHKAAGMSKLAFDTYRRQVYNAQLEYARVGFMLALSRVADTDQEEIHKREFDREFERAMAELNTEQGSVWSILDRLERRAPGKTKNPHSTDEDVQRVAWAAGYDGKASEGLDANAYQRGQQARESDDIASRAAPPVRISLASLLNTFRVGSGSEAYSTLEEGLKREQAKVDGLIESLAALQEPGRDLIRAIRIQGGLDAALVGEIFGEPVGRLDEAAPGLFRSDGAGKSLAELDIEAIEQLLADGAALPTDASGRPSLPRTESGGLDLTFLRDALLAELRVDSSVAAESYAEEIKDAEGRAGRYQAAMGYFGQRMKEKRRAASLIAALPGRRRAWNRGPAETPQLPRWLIDDVAWTEDGEVSLDADGRVEAIAPGEVKKRLPKGVASADDVGWAAVKLGVKAQTTDIAGEKLVQKLMTYRPMEDVARERARERSSHLDPRRAMTPTREAGVALAVRSDLQVELMKRELRHFKKFSDARGISMENAEAVAREKLSRMTVKEVLATKQFEREEVRARSREAEIAAMISRETEAAAKAKGESARVRANLKLSGHWHELTLARSSTMEAFYKRRISAELVKRVSFLKGEARRLQKHIARLYSKDTKKFRSAKSKAFIEYFDIAPDITLQIESVLQTYILATESKKSRAERREAVEQMIADGKLDPAEALPNFQSWREAQFARLGGEEGFAPFLVDNSVFEDDQLVAKVGEGMRRSYQDVTVQELEALFAVLKNLEFLGREKQRLAAIGRARETDKNIETITGNLSKRRRGKPQALTVTEDKTWAQRAGRWLAHVPGSFVNMAAYIRDYVDAGQDIGPAYKIFVRPFQQAEVKKIRLVQGMAERLRRAFEDNLSPAEIQEIRRLRAIPGVTAPDGAPIEMSREDRIAFGLNLGTESNEQALRESPMFEKAETFDAIKDSISVSEWRVIADIHVLLKEFRPMIAELEKRTTGVAPEFIADKEIRTGKTVNGQELVLEGGYVPLAYDGETLFSSPAEVAPNESSPLLSGFSGQGRAMTRQGYLISRRGKRKEQNVLLDLRLIDIHIRGVAHDLAFREAVMQANRYFYDQRFQQGVKDSGRPWLLKRLERHIRNMAEGEISAAGPVSAVIARLKANWTTALLSFSATTIAVQATGHVQSQLVVKDARKYFPAMASGLSMVGAALPSSFTGDYSGTRLGDEVFSESEMMRLRGEVSNKDVMQAMSYVGANKGYYMRAPRALRDRLGDDFTYYIPRDVIEGTLRALQVDSIAGPHRSKEARDWAVRNMFFLTVKMQQTVDVPTYLAAKAEFQALHPERSYEDAVAYAEQAVTRAQGAVLFADQSPFQQGSVDPNLPQNAWQKHAVFMHTYFATKSSLFLNAMNDLRYGPPEQRVYLAMRMAYTVTMLYYVEAMAYVLVTTALKGGFSADEPWEKIWAQTWKETGGNVTSQFYLTGDLYRAALGYDYSSGAVGPVLTAGKFAQQVMQGDLDAPLLKKGVMTLSAVSPLPGVQISRILDAAMQEEPSAYQFIGGNLPPQ